jgi:hypothetical protein
VDRKWSDIRRQRRGHNCLPGKVLNDSESLISLMIHCRDSFDSNKSSFLLEKEMDLPDHSSNRHCPPIVANGIRILVRRGAGSEVQQPQRRMRWGVSFKREWLRGILRIEIEMTTVIIKKEKKKKGALISRCAC